MSSRPKRKSTSKVVNYKIDQDEYDDDDYIEEEKVPKKKRVLHFKNSYHFLDISSWPLISGSLSDDKEKTIKRCKVDTTTSPSVKLTLKTSKSLPLEGIKEYIVPPSQLEKILEVDNDLEFLREFNYPIPDSIKSNALSVTENSQTIKNDIDTDWENRKWEEGTYINCDLRYFNLDSIGKFDIILIDPPWRLRGGQNVSDEKTMFTNNKFYLNYNTLSNEEIIDIDVGALSDSGFIFLWTINSQMEFALDCLERWGYTYIDRIIWIKKTINQNIAVSQGYYLLHSSEICLVGVKRKPGSDSFQHIPKISNDILFAEVKKQSQKPDEIYEIIERMAPGSRKIELFGRNHNIRKGWLTLGNQLGEKFHRTSEPKICFECKQPINVGNKRFKHKYISNFDLCKPCFDKRGELESDFFALDNDQDDMYFHEFLECEGCKFKPLWGLRFSCITCSNLNLCEECYDKKIIPKGKEKSHTEEHKFFCIETPLLAGGLPIHKQKCSGCETFPIVGYRFSCKVCPKLSLCQKCFFLRKEPKKHSSRNHEVELFTDPQLFEDSNVKCVICQTNPIVGVRFKCNGCYDFELCKNCYIQKKPPPMNHISHKPYHTFTVIDGFETYTESEFKASSKKR